MINYRELEDAFLFVSGDLEYMNRAVINKKTGKIYYHSEMTGIDDFPEDVESEDYIVVPHKNELDLGRDLVFRFVSSHLPQKIDEVHQMFRSKGAYRRFKEFLDELGLLDEYHQFQDEQTTQALLQWCEDNGLQVSE